LVAEIEWLADKPGIGGIMVPTMWRDHTPYNHPSYDPVWAACQAAALPVHTHSGEAPREEMNEFIGIYLAEVVFWTHRPIAHLLFSGAFERFPGLKFVVTEGACYWVADMKWKWDQYFGGGHTTKKMAALMTGILSKLPSEYFGTNIFVGASTMSKEEIRRRHTIGCDVAMWGTDYPHPVQVNGYLCKNCTDVDLAKKHIDPAHPRSGPYGIDAKNDPTVKKSDAVIFGGALSALNAKMSKTDIQDPSKSSPAGSLPDVSGSAVSGAQLNLLI